MDSTDIDSIVCFLISPPDKRHWPDRIETKDEKRNYRQRCSRFQVVDATLHYSHKKHGLLRVVRNNEKEQILFACHTSPTAGHLGINKTLSTIATRYYWPAQTQDVMDYIATCEKCQRSNHLRKVPAVLNSIPVPNKNFKQFGVDLIGPLPETEDGNRYIAVAMDYLTKRPEAVALPNKKARTVARFIISLLCRYGRLESVITDQGTEFCNDLNKEILSISHVKHKVCSPYHPQSNGQTERYNQTLINCIVKYVNEKLNDCDVFIDPCLFAYRSSVYKSTGKEPFYLAFGRKAELPIEEELPVGGNIVPTDEEALEHRVKSLSTLATIQANAQKTIGRAQAKQKKYYDAAHEAPKYKVGDLVLLNNARRQTRKGVSLHLAGPPKPMQLRKF